MVENIGGNYTRYIEANWTWYDTPIGWRHHCCLIRFIGGAVYAAALSTSVSLFSNISPCCCNFVTLLQAGVSGML